MAVLNPINMKIFEDAIHAWFSGSTGLTTIWKEQSAPQPSLPFGALQITSGPIAAAPQWENRDSTDLTRPAGTEVKIDACVQCKFAVSCQAYVAQRDASDPTKNARIYANKAHSSLSLPSVLATLRAAGISVIRPGDVLNISELTEDSIESRAGLDATFGAVLALSEYTGFIKKIHMKSTSLGIDEVFDN